MTWAIGLGIASLVTTAVGMGMSYNSANKAADSQNELALLNARAQTQGARQEGALAMMQAKINKALAAKEQQSADAIANNLEQQAAVGTKAAQNDTRKSREEYEQLIAAQRVQMAKSGVLDTSGSPLTLLVKSAQRGQQEADQIRYEDEINRRGLFNQANEARNNGLLARMKGIGAMAEGYGAQGRAQQQMSQAAMGVYSARASSAAMRNQATGNLLSSAAGLATSAYSTFRATPATGANSRFYSVPQTTGARY